MSEKQKVSMIPTGNRRFAMGIFGTCFGLFGLLFAMSWEHLFDLVIEKNLILRPDSPIYELWQAPPLRTVFDIYLFNWTNPQDFRNNSIKPILQEVGPYRFSELPEKTDVVFHSENSSVSYRKRSRYYFDAEGSKGSLSDRIVTINSLAVTAMSQAKRFSPMRRTITEIAMMTYPSDLTLRKTANELLFGGFHDMLLGMAHMIPTSISDVVVPFDRYGYFYGRNSSSKFLGTFNINTGADDISKLGQMNTWNYKNYTKGYSPSCAKVRGSAGEFQGPNMPVNGVVNIFLPEICRDLTLEYDGKVDMNGVLGYKYIGGPLSVDNGTLNSENKCFCNGECTPSGLLNVTSCWYDSPIFVSYPHFYNADPYFAEQVEGMSPQKEKHQFEYIIEPKTSIGLHIKGRTQVNQLIEPMPHSRMFHDVRKIFFPLFWLESNTRLTPELLEFFKPLSTYVLCGQIFGGFCCLIGLILAFWYPIVQYSKGNVDQHLENAEFENGNVKCKDCHLISRDDTEMYLEREREKVRGCNGIATIS